MVCLLAWNASWGPKGWGLLLLLLVPVRAVTGVEGDVVVQQGAVGAGDAGVGSSMVA